MKMPEPMIPPITIIVASKAPSFLASSVKLSPGAHAPPSPARGRGRCRLANLHPQILHEKRVLVGRLFDLLADRFSAAVAGTRLDADQHRRRAGLRFLHLRR